MGYVEWAVGGKTLLCSLKDSNTWESANLGFAWVDEAHRQNERVCRDLETRLRQQNAPRTILYTTNPGGKGWLYKKAHPDGKNLSDKWLWIEAASAENPTLDQDYLDRLVQVYGYMTPAYKRWVLGLSTALEGSVFTEFAPEVSDCIHVVPAIKLPEEWYRGRGLDYGVVNPTCVVWGAQDPETGDWWIERAHYAPENPDMRHEWTVERHAEMICDTDADLGGQMDHVPADPSCWAVNLPDEQTQSLTSVAEKFQNAGVSLTQANNDREQGLNLMLDMMAIDPERQHPASLEMGAPRLYILDREENEPVIQELQKVEWKRPEGTTEEGRPDDIRKKNDHAYDAMRYLFMESPPDNIANVRREPIRSRPRADVIGSRGQARHY